MYINACMHGNKIYVRDTTGDYVVEDFKPKLFFRASQKTDHISAIENMYVTPIEYDNHYEFYQALKNSNQLVAGNKNIVTQFMQENYADANHTNFDDLKIFNIDIEVDSKKGFPKPEEALWPINAITVKYNDIFYIWGLRPNEDTFKVSSPDQKYKEFTSESELLMDFMNFWADESPHIVTGWNTDGFDIPYIYNRVTKKLGTEVANYLSPYGICKPFMKDNDFGGQTMQVSVSGLSQLDYLALYKKFVLKPRENYKLDTIAEVELGEAKLSYEEYGNLKRLYQENYQLFIDYNITDVELVSRLDENLNLLRLAVTIANYGKINYEQVYSPIRTWESTIYHHLMRQGRVPEIRNKSVTKDGKFKGAFVIPPIPSFYKWIIAFDLDSLYPSIIRQWNIGGDTIVDPFKMHEGLQKFLCNVDEDELMSKSYDFDILKQENVTISPSGYIFTKDRQSFLSELSEELFSTRYAEKTKMKQAEAEGRKEDQLLHDTFQHAMKILLNSLYGALGSVYCQYYDLRLAESITKAGQLVLKSTRDMLNKRLKHHNGGVDLIIAGDTDSVYLSIENIVNKECPDGTLQEQTDFVDNFSKKVIERMIRDHFKEIFDYMNCYSNNMNMTREVIANNGIWCAKKRYALSVIDNEGYRYQEPQVKISGLEIIKSTTPKYSATVLKGLVNDILLDSTEQEIVTKIDKFKKDFKLEHISSTATNTSVNNIEKYQNGDWYNGGTQAHIRGAINYNRFIKNNEHLQDKDLIISGDKVKLVPLLTPNPIEDDQVAFIDYFPDELTEFIDYERLFDKAFMSPLEKVTTVINWTLEPESHAAGLF